MTPPEFDIHRFLTNGDGLPHLNAAVAEEWITTVTQPDDRTGLWNEVCRQWLDVLAPSLGPTFSGVETDHFFVVADTKLGRRNDLADHAEKCRAALFSVLGSAAAFSAPGKQVILAFSLLKTMYRFAGPLFPEGDHGSFAGLHVRGIVPLVLTIDAQGVESILAHELLHASVSHLDLPLWLEEGLAQTFEVDLGHGQPLLITPEDARECRTFWLETGLARFWDGAGFGLPGEIQKESYRLAQILVRLLLDDAKPGFFGWGRARQLRFTSFVRAAKCDDAGAVAYREVFGQPMVALAERFLGKLPAKFAPAELLAPAKGGVKPSAPTPGSPGPS
jgi:hypothetical protein